MIQNETKTPSEDDNNGDYDGALFFPYAMEEMRNSQEDPRLGVVIKGLRTETIASVDQALEYLANGERCRLTGEHLLNSTSSRSHAIFTIYLESVAGMRGRESCGRERCRPMHARSLARFLILPMAISTRTRNGF